MELIEKYQFSWLDVGQLTLILFLAYLGLQILLRIIARVRFLGSYQSNILRFFKKAYWLFEPLAIILLVCAFVTINPFFHSLILLIVLLTGMRHLKDYFSGRVLLVQGALSVGNRVATQSINGILKSIGRLGVEMNIGDGIRFINYSQLTQDGFTVLEGKTVGGFYDLLLLPNDKDTPNQLQALRDLLAVTPYLDQQHFPKIKHSLTEPEKIEVRLMVREEKYLTHFMALLQERGYNSQILK